MLREQPQVSLLVSLRNLTGHSDSEQHGKATEERQCFHLKVKSIISAVLQGDFSPPLRRGGRADFNILCATASQHLQTLNSLKEPAASLPVRVQRK